VIGGDVAEGIAALKERPGENLLKFGTGALDRTLLRAKLVDEYHFWVFPVLGGSGERLFSGVDTTHLKLVDQTRFESGIVVGVYAPK
jgi:dihydrofolate reductase